MNRLPTVPGHLPPLCRGRTDSVRSQEGGWGEGVLGEDKRRRGADARWEARRCRDGGAPGKRGRREEGVAGGTGLWRVWRGRDRLERAGRVGGLPGGGAKVRGRPFPAPWVTVASPRALEARRDLNSNLRPGKDCPAFCRRSRGSARLVASGPRGDRGRGLGRGVVAMETSQGRSLPHPEREEQNAQLVGTQLLRAPVQRNQHYYFLEYFYLHHFLYSSITQ